MKSSILDEQRAIQTQSDVFWIMQIARNISKDDEQYIPEAIT